MTYDADFSIALFVGTALIVVSSIEAGHWLGRMARHRSGQEKDSSVTAVTSAVFALLTFILAFTFGIAANRFDDRKDLVRDEANIIRTAWSRSDFLPDPDRAEAKLLFADYVRARLAAVQFGDDEHLERGVSQADSIQGRLWSMAVRNARKDMNSDVAALYIESLNEVAAVHASRVALALQIRVPLAVWLALAGLTILGMTILGYQLGHDGSKKGKAALILATAFGLVVAMIGALDHPISGLTVVSQRPLVELLSSIEAGSN